MPIRCHSWCSNARPQLVCARFAKCIVVCLRVSFDFSCRILFVQLLATITMQCCVLCYCYGFIEKRAKKQKLIPKG